MLFTFGWLWSRLAQWQQVLWSPTEEGGWTRQDLHVFEVQIRIATCHQVRHVKHWWQVMHTASCQDLCDMQWPDGRTWDRRLSLTDLHKIKFRIHIGYTLNNISSLHVWCTEWVQFGAHQLGRMWCHHSSRSHNKIPTLLTTPLRFGLASCDPLTSDQKYKMARPRGWMSRLADSIPKCWKHSKLGHH